MNQFTFTFHETEFIGHYILSNIGRGWFKVIFLDHSVIIFPTIFQTKDKKCIWVQHARQGDTIWPHDLIQTMGERIEWSLEQNQVPQHGKISLPGVF
jgi:hypothetical protein